MSIFNVVTDDGNIFVVEAWSESDVIWAMSYEGYTEDKILKIKKS